jgi:hypothetical protein
MGNRRNALTTHPKLRARRERALGRFWIKEKHAGDADYLLRKEVERDALIRKLAQRKQGSAR